MLTARKIEVSSNIIGKVGPKHKGNKRLVDPRVLATMV